MAIITQVIHCTDENRKADCLEKCLESIHRTVDFDRHRMVIVDNDSNSEAKEIAAEFVREVNCYRMLKPACQIILPENVGTARAINKAWMLRNPREHVVKIDDDVVFNDPGWLDDLEAAADRLWRGWEIQDRRVMERVGDFEDYGHGGSRIGMLGLKRKDLGENMFFPDQAPGVAGWGRTVLEEVHHRPGEPWYCFERVLTNPLMGTVVLHNWRLLDEVGFMYQGPFKYGYDDTIMTYRARLAGYEAGFLYGRADIDHIDPGDTPYQKRKENMSPEQREWIERKRYEFVTGTLQIHHGPEDE